jgi:type IV secretory system conjugative DNA transfer VirD4/TraG family protein
MPENYRRDFYLYIDEFHNFTTESFASILSEARKYRLSMILSHQYIEQLHRTLSAAIFGNVANLIAFRVGEHDAHVLSRDFGEMYTPGTFSGLGNFNVIAKLLENGEQSEPFIGRTTPPIAHVPRKGQSYSPFTGEIWGAEVCGGR